MKDPAFLFYPNDYIGGTMGMTFEQKGAYMDLLMMQFNRGHMTNHMIGQVLGQEGGQLWDTIKDKFIIDGEGRYYNQRLEIEQNKRKQFTDSRKNNRNGKNQYTKKGGQVNGHMTSHMENRNEDIIISLSKSSSNESSRLEQQGKPILFDFDCVKKRQYLESVYRAVVIIPDFKVSIERFESLSDQFIAEQQLKDEPPRNVQDYKNHFISWMKIQVVKPENQPKTKMVY